MSPIFASDVQLNVEVVERKPTDTINDFDFSTVNVAEVKQAADSVSSGDNGAVAGVQTKSPSPKHLFSALAISTFFFGGLTFSVIKKRKSRQPELQQL